jgi:hypothetical protein
MGPYAKVRPRHPTVPRLGRHFMRRGVVIRSVINNFTFDGATKDAMQQAVRDALIAFMAAAAQGTGRGYKGRSAGQYRACEASR